MLHSEKIGLILISEQILLLSSNSIALGGQVFDEHFNASAELYKKREFRRAIKELNIAIEAEPNNFQGYYKRAKCFSETDSPQESMRDFAIALRLNPGFADIWVSRALAYQRLNDSDRAIEDLKRAIAIDSKHSKALYKLLLLCFRQNDFRTGIKYSTRAIDQNFERSEMLMRRGAFYARAGERKKMLADFALAISEEQEKLSILEGAKIKSPKEIEKAKKNLARVYNERGKVFADLRDFDSALKDFQEALRIVPNDTTYMCNIGGALLHKKENEKALEILTEACKLRTDSASLHNNLGIALDKTGRRIEAKQEFEKALNIDSSKTHYFANHARMALTLGDAEEAMGDFVGISSMNEKGAVRSPEHAYPVLRQIDELIKLNPTDPANYYNRGIINFAQKNFIDAERDFKRFLTLQNGFGESPTYGSIFLSLSLENLGRHRQALEILSAARIEANTAWTKRLLTLYVGEKKLEDFLESEHSLRRELAASCFVGLKKLVEGDNVSAEERLKWVRDHAQTTQDEYLLAISGLNCIEGKNKTDMANGQKKRKIREAVSEEMVSFK